jgi:hypothetical protein
LARSKILVTILFLCLILIFIYLLTGYFKEQRTQAAVMRQIETSTLNLKQLPAPPAGLAERLEEITLANQNAKQGISGENINSTEIIFSLLETADEYNLKVDPLASEGWIKKNIGASTYRVLPVKLEITGKLTDLIDFLNRLENKESFPNLAIEDLTITYGGIAEQSGTSIAATEITAILKVSVINRLETGN